MTDTLWGFKVGDIITDDASENSAFWSGKRVKVKKFEEEKLWGIMEGETTELNATEPDKLILLERPGWKFKVGDEVTAIGGSPKGLNGKVVVFDPGSDPEDWIYLVEFPDWNEGNCGKSCWNEPWYPQEHKTDNKYRCWCKEDDLELVKASSSGKQNTGKENKQIKRQSTKKPKPTVIVHSTGVTDKELMAFFCELLKVFKKESDKKVYPLFLPDKVSTLKSGKLKHSKEWETTRDFSEGMHYLAVTIYHLATGLSGINRESFLFDGYPAITSVCWPALEFILTGNGDIGFDQIEEKLGKAEADPETIPQQSSGQSVKNAVKGVKGQSNRFSMATHGISHVLEALLAGQTDILIQKGYHTAASISEEEFRAEIAPLYDKLLEIAEDLEASPIKESNLPILLVISKDFVSLQNQLERIELNGEKGDTDLDLSKIFNRPDIQVPQGKCWLITDVENGKENQGKSPEASMKLIIEAGRTAIIVEEGVALVIQCPEIANDHDIDLTGSCFNSLETMLSLEIVGKNRKPILSEDNIKELNCTFGSPSARSRVGF